MNRFNLIRVRGEELMVNVFEIHGSIASPLEEMKSVIKDFLRTEAGVDSLTYTGNFFNWGDALSEIPKEHYEDRGIYLVNSVPCGKDLSAQVFQDENLFSLMHEDFIYELFA